MRIHSRSHTRFDKTKRLFGAALAASAISASALGGAGNLPHWVEEGAHYGESYVTHVVDHAYHDLTDTSSSVIPGDKVSFSEEAKAQLITGEQAVQNPSAAAEKSWDALKPFSETSSGLFKNTLQPNSSTAGSIEQFLGFGSKFAGAWPQSQGTAGALDLSALNGSCIDSKALLDSLRFYQISGIQVKGPNGNEHTVSAYSPSGPTGLLGIPRQDEYFYYDDNSWIGLDLMQAYSQTHEQQYLTQAEQLYQFIRTGQAETGGMHWRELDGTKSQGINTIATGASSEFAMELYFAAGRQEYLQFAQKNMDYLNTHLRTPQGLYQDHQGSDQSAKAIYSYNQGVTLGANALLAKAYYQMYQENPGENSGDLALANHYLALANQTAIASMKELSQPAESHNSAGETRLWKQPPAFNAIYFRNLLSLGDAASQGGGKVPAASPLVEQAQSNSMAGRVLLKSYLQSAWNNARDPKTGLLDQGGIGHYGGTVPDYLDQSAFVQMYSLLGISGENLYRSI